MGSFSYRREGLFLGGKGVVVDLRSKRGVLQGTMEFFVPEGGRVCRAGVAYSHKI